MVPLKTSNSRSLPSFIMSYTLYKMQCEECQESQNATYFCIDCDTTFCGPCWLRERSHAPGKLNRDGVPHERLPSKEVISRLQDIFTPASDPKAQTELHKSDAGSKWFGVTKSFEGTPVLHDYDRYASVMRDNVVGTTTRWPQLLSFVGQTGAGKSTLIKVLIEYRKRMQNIRDENAFPSPVAGSVNAHAPTSGDVHLYADPGSYYTPYPILYADCEGMDGGEKIPIGSSNTWGIGKETVSAKSKLADSSRSWSSNKLQKHSKSSKRVLKWADSPEKRKREFAVKNLYPRILYAFSDIIVFVLRNDRTFESAALVPLLQWADSSVESSVNQSAMPHVMIVLNCADPGIEEAGWSVENATDSLLGAYSDAVRENPHVKEFTTYWQDRGRTIKTTKDLLHCYYSSVTVIRVPQKGRYGLVDAQISELSLQLQRRSEEARENRKRLRVAFNAEEFQQALSMGFDHFANRLDEPLDFVQISCKSHPIPQNFGGNILRLALAMKDDPRMAGKTGRDIFKLLGQIVASSIMLDYIRQQIKGTHSRLLLHYKENYSRALKQFCELFWPCTFTYRGHRCVNTQRGHIKGHQDASGKILYDGPFESADNFTQQNFEEEWHRMLEDNLGHMRERMSKMTRGEIAMEEKTAVTELHLERINDFYSQLGALSNYNNHSACFCCLRGFPEHPLPCGHVLCTLCVKSFAHKKNLGMYALEWCPLHKHQRWDEEWEISVKPDLAGVRVLTLDGGGVRGIVELQVLGAIQKHLGPLSIADFFDLIVGTSAGGIIALGLGVKDWPIENCTRKFRELCFKAFTPRFAPGVQQVASGLFNTSKYKTEPYNDILRGTFGEEQLFGGRSEGKRYQRKVAVVATAGTGQEAVILANYNRPPRTAEPDYKFERPWVVKDEMKIWEACRATSSAPTFFKPYHHPHSGRSYIDGALYYNNPARVAHQERKLLWPNMENEPPDIVLSIGSGFVPKNKLDKDLRRVDTRTYKIALNRFDNLLDAQIAWDNYEREVRDPDEPKNTRYIRLNPQLKSKVKLDEAEKLGDLSQRVSELLRSTRCVVETRNIARRLIASSFFFEKNAEDKEKGIIKGWICCRFPDESKELRHLGRFFGNLGSRQFSPFFIICEEDEQNHGFLRVITKEVVSAMISESTFKLDMLEIQPSLKQARMTISLCLSKNGEIYPISGFPRYLEANISQSRPRRKDATAIPQHTPVEKPTTNIPQNGQSGKEVESGASTHAPNVAASGLPGSSAENLSLQSTDEEIPFWARSLRNSAQGSLNEDSPDTPSSKAEIDNEAMEVDLLDLTQQESLLNCSETQRPELRSPRSSEISESSEHHSLKSPRLASTFPISQSDQPPDYEASSVTAHGSIQALHPSNSNPDIPLRQSPPARPEPGRWRSAGDAMGVIPQISDLTEKEILEIVKMRSLEKETS